MTFNDKIDEWIAEAETRPGSALMILKLIAGRLRDLTERNEELLAENIALQDGSRVETYQKRISYLEYQLELLKRRLGADDSALEALAEQEKATSLLVYNATGRILRLEAGAESAGPLGRLTGELSAAGEPPRLLALPAREEVLLLFTSGRISTLPVSSLPAAAPGESWDWEAAPVPEEPHAGEQLACLLPLARLSLADFFLQASRRGFVKKTPASLTQSILENHFLGRGTLQKADQAFDLLLGQKKDLLALVSAEGRLLGLASDNLSFSAEERLRLELTDYVIAACALRPDDVLLCLTQTGKVIQREGKMLELAKSAASRGQALISPARLEQGTRFIGAAAVRAQDRLIVLDAAGWISLHGAGEAAAAGNLHAEAVILSMGLLPARA
jgi:DNA gyrase/topoisomerase IV subunit A